MKKLTTLLFIAGLFFSTQILAQTVDSVLWDLSTNTQATVSSGFEVTADTMAWTYPLALKDFTGGALSGPAIRLNDTAGVGWGPLEPGPENTRYIQFLVKPNAGNSLQVDSIAFWLASYGTRGYLHAAVYWDTDTANFSQNHLIDYDSLTSGPGRGLPDVRGDNGDAGDPYDTSFVINTKVNDGGLFAFRIYPWYNATTASKTKYVVMWLVRVYGTTTPATGVNDAQALPKQFSLKQNYPNPFNPTTKISFETPKSSFVSLNVYNLLGQKVASLVNEVVQAGSHTVNFNASNLPSGVYLYQLRTDNFNSIKKMTLLK
jgi:hypothetical protein